MQWTHQTLLNRFVNSYSKRLDMIEEIDILDKEIKELQHCNQGLQQQLSDQDQDVRRAQETAFAFISMNTPRAEDDESIRSQLKVVRGQWKIFAKDWVSKDLHRLKGDYPTEVRQLVERLLTIDELEAHDGIMAKENVSKAVAILLNTALAGFIGQHIINQPFISAFGLLMKAADGANSSMLYMHSLGKLYRQFLEGLYHLIGKQN